MLRKIGGVTFFVLFAATIAYGFISAIWNRPAFPSLRTFEVVYEAEIPAAGDAMAGPLKVWLPLASDAAGQKILKRTIEAPEGYQIIQDPAYGNDIIYYEGDENLRAPLKFKVRYLAELSQRDFLQKKNSETEDPAYYLKPSRLTASNELTRGWAREVTSGKKDVHAKARAIYDFVHSRMSYDKTAPGWGEGNTERACLIGKGNCTDFHSLFITMARDAGIPARFKIGFTVPGENAGVLPSYHCWAEYFAPGEGWFPVDVSDAWKKPEWKEAYFRDFDTNKFMISKGRDVPLKGRDEPVNILFYPLAARGGEDLEGIKTSFSYNATVSTT